MQWYYVFSREMLLLWKKIGKFGYIFSSIMTPLLYLFAFGMGLGGRQIAGIEGSYTDFLSKGMIGTTVMLNAFQQTSLSVSVTRFYFGSFQTMVLSPVSASQMVFGIALAGVARGIVMGATVWVAAWLVFDASAISPVGFMAIFLAAFCFAALGLVIGLFVNNPDALSLVNNFLIMPMTLFCGAFFPVENLPRWAGMIVSKLPLSLVNKLLRNVVYGKEAWLDMSALAVMGVLSLCLGTIMLERYSE